LQKSRHHCKNVFSSEENTRKSTGLQPLTFPFTSILIQKRQSALKFLWEEALSLARPFQVILDGNFPEIFQFKTKLFVFQDFCMTVIVAVFWLAASAAWANGVINMKYTSDPTNWIYRNTKMVSILFHVLKLFFYTSDPTNCFF
jgi:hypothetical protein